MGALTRQMRAFAAAKARLGDARGTGLAAAREAGYRGSDATLAVRATKLGKDHRVRAEIARLRAAARAAGTVEGSAPTTALADGQAPAAVLEPPRPIAAQPLTLTRKLQLLAELAEDREAKDADRIRAIELASKLDGDLSAAGGGGDVAAVAAASASSSATVVVWVGNGRGPAPSSGGDG